MQKHAAMIQKFKLGDFSFEIRKSRDVLWVISRSKDGAGIALRTVYSPDGDLRIENCSTRGRVTTLRMVASTTGTFTVAIELYDPKLSLFRVTVTLKPVVPRLMPPQPWNIYPIDADDNPLTTRGIVHAAQRGSAAGLLYFTITKPATGSALYFQNLTALNDYFQQTHTTPNTVVGNSWPGLGFMLPASDDKALEKGRSYGICDAFERLSPEVRDSPQASARLFLEMFVDFYVQLRRPETLYRDWHKMSRATLRDLERSPECRVEEQGYLYLHPYVGAEYPDSMVQLTVLLPLLGYADWSHSKIALIGRLRESVRNFYDPKLGTIRRYLATVGDDKKDMEVDS